MGDFVRLLSLDLSPSGRMTASPVRQPSGLSRLTESADQAASNGGHAKQGSKQTQSSSRAVKVSLTVHPDDSMAWVTVDIIATCQARRAGQFREPDSSLAVHHAISDQTRAASGSDDEDAGGQLTLSGLAVESPGQPENEHTAAAVFGEAAEGGETAPVQSAPADVNRSATAATNRAVRAGGAAPPVDDWVAALPAVPKLPIMLATATVGAKATSGVAAVEPSYADITAQLVGSDTDASSSTEASGADEESPSSASEDEDTRERDPRRELELDIAVADALAQVGILSVCCRPSEPRLKHPEHHFHCADPNLEPFEAGCVREVQ